MGGRLNTRESRAHLIEAHGVENVPSRHLTAVLIAAETVNVVAVLLLEHPVDKFLCAVGASGIVIEVNDVV